MILLGRILMYMSLMLLPMIHPSTVQHLDLALVLRLFVFMPLAVFLAWKKSYSFRERGFLHLFACIMPLFALPFLSFTTSLLELFLFVQYAYWSTWLIFRHHFSNLLYIDSFYFAFVIYRIMGLHVKGAFNVIAFGLLIVGFLAYALLIYRLKFTPTRQRTRELAIALFLPFLFGILIALFLPDDFASELRLFNNIDNIIRPPFRPLLDSAESIMNDGNQLSSEIYGGEDSGGGEGSGSGEGSADAPEVFMLPSDSWSRWGEGRANEGEPANQYMVMIVESSASPLYLADEYFNHLDSRQGFHSDPTFILNRLTYSQYLETWQNPDPVSISNRRLQWINVYSTISRKLSMYDPYQIEPTIFNTEFYPLTYVYRSESRVSHISLSQKLPELVELRTPEQETLRPYLEIDLPDEIKETYMKLIDEIFQANETYNERIQAILEHYREYHYELGFTDDVSIAAISDFLFNTKRGDCTEFSNSAAILGRLAGIPSRVVTGYLLSENLQTSAHKRALAHIQGHYSPIVEKNLSSLYLITTAHRHSWTQFYLPAYGWVDFETTSFAIPPTGNINPNNLDIVIPDLSDRTLPQRRLSIPLGFMLVVLVLFVVIGLLLLYTIRWAKLVRLVLLSRRADERSCKSLYRLLIIRLYARGYDLKGIDLTPVEYARFYPELNNFAQTYTKIIFQGDWKNMDKLRGEYHHLLKHKPWLPSLLRELFSLKDMKYL